MALEVDAVARHGNARDLATRRFEPVVVHDDLPVAIVDMDVRRGDMRGAHLVRHRVANAHAAFPVARFGPAHGFGRDRWRLIGERGLLEMETAGDMDAPRPGQRIRVRKTDVAALVVREVEVVAPEPVGHPIRHANQRGTLDVGTDARMSVGSDDGSVHQPLHANELILRR